MNVLIIYNVNINDDLKKRLKEELKKIGYFDSWVFDNNTKKVFLPPNTLWKKDIEIGTPLNELKTVLGQLDIPISNLLNCIVVPASPWNGIAGVQS